MYAISLTNILQDIIYCLYPVFNIKHMYTTGPFPQTEQKTDLGALLILFISHIESNTFRPHVLKNSFRGYCFEKKTFALNISFGQRWKFNFLKVSFFEQILTSCSDAFRHQNFFKKLFLVGFFRYHAAPELTKRLLWNSNGCWLVLASPVQQLLTFLDRA